MKFEPEKLKKGDDQSIHIEIIQRQTNSGDLTNNNWGSNLFEPQRDLFNPTPMGKSNDKPAVPAPEKKLTLFALRLAILEKAASHLGALGFIWATVVLLGGFATTLGPKDFWFVTVILLTEGTRIFSRSHELEWQHQATAWSLTSAGRYSFHAIASSSRAIKNNFLSLLCIKLDAQHGPQTTDDMQMVASRFQNTVMRYRPHRSWHLPEVPVLSYAGSLFLLRNVSSIFYWLQMISAVACAALSLMRLIQQDYKQGGDGNGKSALNWFYALALMEVLMFLTERAYWQWKINYCKLLEEVSRECNLGPFGIISIKRFFYDSYSKCINKSIFSGLKMDLVSFGQDLLDSDSRDEQLIGAQILQRFTTNKQFAVDTLRKIESSTRVAERLIEMLNWKNAAEEEIRRLAAQVVSNLAGKKHTAIRVTEISGAMESISSLLYTCQGSYEMRPHEIGKQSLAGERTSYEFSVFNSLGLQILKKLARDHENCWKIGNTSGLMPKIIDSTSASENLLRNEQTPETDIKTVKRALQLVKILVSTTGQTGKMLRKQISDIVFTVSNIRELLQHGERHMVLQKLATEVLIGLAMDEEARERIGSTGSMIKLLLSIFFKLRLTEEENSVSTGAGEALALLALESSRNCCQILKEEDVVGRLIHLLNDPALKVNSSRILRNLCAYSGVKCFIQLHGVIAAIPTVVEAIMNQKDKTLEVSIGLAAQIFRFTNPENHAKELKAAGIADTDFANKIVEILKTYNRPEIKVPRIRRFTVELAIWLMESQEKYIQIFKSLDAHEPIKCAAETTSELESFNIFSGSVGLGRNNTTLGSLVDTALQLMGQG